MTLTGKNNYTGTRIFDFTIDKKNVADTDVSISYDSVQSYTGSAVTPEVTLMYNGELMVKDRDYKITYSNNIASIFKCGDDHHRNRKFQRKSK